MKVSDYIVKYLVQNGIDKVFGYIGGNNAHILDSVDKNNKIEFVNSRHEQGSGFAAEGYARVTSKTGVASVTSGPGGTNLVTPISSCFLDSVPSLFIVGDVNSSEHNPDSRMRQIGFQDIDIVSMVKPITKYSVFVEKLSELRYELEKAYYFTQEGRAGPVLISIPVDFQYQENYKPEQENSFFDSEEYQKIEQNFEINEQDVNKVIKLINEAQRPVILVGNGVRLANAQLELREFIEKSNIPLVHSLMGKDVIETDYLYNLGFIGRWGNRYGNLTLANSDLIILLGSRVDTLQTGKNTKSFVKNKKIIQIDIDKYELGERIDVDLPILGDVKLFLKKLNFKNIDINIKAWHSKVLSYKKSYPHQYEIDKCNKIGNQIVALISNSSKENDIFTVDVGEHQMVSAQALQVKKGQRILFTGGLGSMGFSIPSAIGSTLGTGNRAIVIVGDGGIQMNIQELEVIYSRNLPIKIFIFNNASLYMVTMIQDSFLEGRHIATKEDYSAPDFKKIGESYGIKSYQVSKMNEIEETIKICMKNNNPELIEIKLLGEDMKVSPRLDYSRAYADMSPYLDRDEYKKMMIMKS